VRRFLRDDTILVAPTLKHAIAQEGKNNGLKMFGGHELHHNRSMAVWCPQKGSDETATVEYHFNFWRLPRRSWWRKLRTWRWGAQRDFVEIGILVDQPDQIDCICIFLPFLVECSTVTDCGPYFRDENIAEGIFNEKISIGIPAAKDGAFVDLKVDGNTFCRVHEFELSNNSISDNHLKLKPVDHGTMLEISPQAVGAPATGISADGKTYFRLRVRMPDENKNPFIQRIHPADWALQSGFEAIELINFRLNEMRTLPDTVQSKLRQNGGIANAQVRLVAFLTAIPAISDMTSASSPSHKSRTLESEIWDKYVDNGLPHDVAVYHWKKERNLENGPTSINEFSAFVKLKQRRAGLGTIAIYLLIAFAFGVFGNLTASWLDAKYPHLLSSQQEETGVETPTLGFEPGDAKENE
jgi:hypothetical protein